MVTSTTIFRVRLATRDLISCRDLISVGVTSIGLRVATWLRVEFEREQGFRVEGMSRNTYPRVLTRVGVTSKGYE